MEKKFKSKGYKDNLRGLIEKEDNTDQKGFVRKKEKSNKERIPCLITYKRKLPNMRKVLKKYWNVLQINQELRETFLNIPFLAFKRNKSLQEIIG